MTPEALRQAAITLFGDRGWMSRLSECLGVDRSSVSRWFAGLPPPGPVVAAVEAWLVIHRLTGLRPDELETFMAKLQSQDQTSSGDARAGRSSTESP